MALNDSVANYDRIVIRQVADKYNIDTELFAPFDGYLTVGGTYLPIDTVIRTFAKKMTVSGKTMEVTNLGYSENGGSVVVGNVGAVTRVTGYRL